jgi:phytoene dehydrogenase-like protein
MQIERNSAPTQAIVVGGGLAGLTAAAYLARAGHPVTVFEKAPRLGGRAATQFQEGYAFNRGIHALYTGGAASKVLAALGVRYTAGSPGETFILDGGRLSVLPTGPLALLRSGLLSVGDKAELIRVLANVRKADPHALARVSVQDWLADAVHRLPVRRLLAALARTFVYCAALDLVSAEVLVDKLQRTLRHPVHYIDGGWQTLVDGLLRVATEAGAKVVTNTHVVAVECDGNRVSGVRLRDGSRISAAAVILATTPHDAAALVESGPAGAALRRAVDSLVPGHLACLDVALRGLPDPRHPIVQDVDQPLFFSAQSQCARVAPGGGALVHAFKQLDPRWPANARADERDLEDFLDRVQPGWRERVVRQVNLPHILATGALPTASDGGFAGRPGTQAAGVDGLYLAGDWVGAEGFLADAALASARAAAARVLERAALVGTRRPLVGAPA